MVPTNETFETMNRPRESDVKDPVINRLRSISGHVNGIIRMMEEDQYCIDIINQIQAVQSALNKVSLIVLEDHMHHCVTDAIRSGNVDEAEQTLDELKGVFETLSRL